ncbi:hypothetical protein VE00_06406 [Pseudogymnoascus sp. WSF 3629]|nr:hypothetical protein VE00_06406 [Pseudogymnoascus sp. WSF 3629]
MAASAGPGNPKLNVVIPCLVDIFKQLTFVGDSELGLCIAQPSTDEREGRLGQNDLVLVPKNIVQLWNEAPAPSFGSFARQLATAQLEEVGTAQLMRSPNWTSIHTSTAQLKADKMRPQLDKCPHEHLLNSRQSEGAPIGLASARALPT